MIFPTDWTVSLATFKRAIERFKRSAKSKLSTPTKPSAEQLEGLPTPRDIELDETGDPLFLSTTGSYASEYTALPHRNNEIAEQLFEATLRQITQIIVEIIETRER